MSARVPILLSCLILACMAMAPATAWSAGQETDPETPVDKPLNPMAKASEVERTSIRQLLGSSQWPQRVVALMRMQRFDCAESADLIASGLNDQATNVRCFALLVLGHRQVPQSATWLANEADPRVIRTAVRCGYHVDPERLKRGVSALSRSSRLADKLSAAELGLASGDPELMELSEELLRTIILRMEDAEAGALSPRLARITSGTDLRRDFKWRQWYQKHRGDLGLDPAVMMSPQPRRDATNQDLPSPGNPDDLSKIALMPIDKFISLAEHLQVLGDKPLDLAIVIDCTASMSGEIAEAQGGVDDLMYFVGDVCDGVRVGVVGYRDRRSRDFEQIGWNFTPSIDEARRNLWRLSAEGGGDRPELVNKGLELGYEKLAWNRTHRGILVLVGDAPPHPGRGASCVKMAKTAFDRGVTTHVIGCDPRIQDTERSNPEDEVTVDIETKDGPAGLKSGANRVRRRPGQPRQEIEFFPQIAEAGGGRVVNLARDERLVPEIAGLVMGEDFEPPLVEFFKVYLQICR